MTYSDQRRKGDGKLKRKESPARKEKNQRANEHKKRKTLKKFEEEAQKFKRRNTRLLCSTLLVYNNFIFSTQKNRNIFGKLLLG